MKIENIRLLELFLETVCTARDNVPADFGQTPTQSEACGDYASRGVTLAELLGDQDSILESLVLRFEHSGQEQLAEVLREIASALSDAELLAEPDGETGRRLLDYVYPVV